MYKNAQTLGVREFLLFAKTMTIVFGKMTI